jgi:predicted  nucleic acid-binding Zn-ribbon protein
VVLPRLTPDRGDTLKADPFAQLKLLDVQELDSRIDAIDHQLRTLPEIAQLKENEARRRELDDRSRDLRVSVDDLTSEQKKADADVEQVKTRRERDRSRMDQGLITNPKDLERMGHELESLERRITSLEDTELEVMERLEETQAALDAVTVELAASEEAVLTVTESRDRKAGVLRDDREGVVRERAAAVDGLPEDLVKLYERLRAQKNGVGAAPLRARECGGCRLQLDASDLVRITKAPTDEVIRCEECDRILVRTSESGLATPQ